MGNLSSGMPSSMLDIKRITDFSTKNAIRIVLVLLVVIITVINPRFASLECLRDILLQSATRMIIALGAAFILITGGVDLSAGRMVGFAAVVSASMLQTPDYLRRFFPDLPQLPLFVPIIIAIALGLLFGILNGFIVAKFQVPPFIATLGTMVIILGVNSLYFNMPPNNSQPIGGLRADFTNLGSGAIGIEPILIPNIVIIAGIIAYLVWIIFNKTTLGKNMYAIGGNINAARVSGINVGLNILIIYAIAGALYGIAGVLEAAKSGGASNNYGNMYELDAIAACVVGGVSTNGGIGTVLGVLSGVLIFSVINYGLTFIGVDPYWQLIIKGAIIVVAVALDIRQYLTRH